VLWTKICHLITCQLTINLKEGQWNQALQNKEKTITGKKQDLVEQIRSLNNMTTKTMGLINHRGRFSSRVSKRERDQFHLSRDSMHLLTLRQDLISQTLKQIMSRVKCPKEGQQESLTIIPKEWRFKSQQRFIKMSRFKKLHELQEG